MEEFNNTVSNLFMGFYHCDKRVQQFNCCLGNVKGEVNNKIIDNSQFIKQMNEGSSSVTQAIKKHV